VPSAPSIRRVDGTRISTSEADSLARRTFAENHVTGAQIALLNDGKIVWTAAFGLRDREHNLPMNPETTTWAASITKSVFAVYVMKLVEQNRMQLDTPVINLLDKPLDSYPEYRESAVELVRDPRFAAITPRMLLSHSSGLANFAYLEPDRKMHLHFAPGSRFAYSGEGINLLQFVIEQREHKPLEELMQDAIFTPLQMHSTSLLWNERFAANVADRYDLHEEFIAHTRRDHARGAGSMTTSVVDLARFTAALLASSSQEEERPSHSLQTGGLHSTPSVLRPATLKAMLTPVIRIDALREFPTLEEAKGAEGPAVGLAYGLGWGLLTKTKYGPAFFKEGHGDGAQNYMICFTKHRDCIILLTNSDNGELAFRPLLEGLLGDTVTPWVWENYTPDAIAASREQH
jgi:CubicO group peptidase (beta-lactamase class C family)